MPNFHVTRLGLAVPALLALGILSASAGPDQRDSQAIGALGCEIDISRTGGMVELQALVTAPRETAGQYRLRVVKSGGGGGAQIDQSGPFSVGGGGANVVSSVTLGGGGRYTARLSVTVDGRTVECSRRVDGAI